MKNLFVLLGVLMLASMFTSCERVAPNYQGVMMTDYGKNGKSDFKLVKGRVNTAMPGTELFQVPLWEQRGEFGDRILHLKSADNTEFTSAPMYSYNVIEDMAIDVVFQNKQIKGVDGEEFMNALEDNILEMKIYDVIKEVSRKWTTQALMETTTLPDGTTTSGSLKFEKEVQDIIEKEFKAKGLKLNSFSCQLQFTTAVTDKIDKRNEVNTNIQVIEQKIIEQQKQLELERITAEITMVPLVVAKKNGVLEEYVRLKGYESWKEVKQPIYGNTPFITLK